MLSVLALAVRPPPLLPETHAVTVELIPPLTPPVPPPLPVLRRLSEDETPPQPLKPTARPEAVLPQPTEVARPAPPAPRPLSAAPRAPDLTPPAPLPPAPLEVARPQPALPRPVAIPAPAPSRTILADRPAPPVLQPSPPAPAPAPAAAQVQVLTNQQVIQAPIEIRPPDRTVNPLSTAPPTPPVILNPEGAGAAAGSGALAGGGGAPSGGAGAGARLGGPVIGFGDALRGGLRMRLGCATPDTYKLTPQERAECLRRLAEEAKAAAEMGINIPPAKQAEFDRQRACHAATTQGGVPSSTSQTTGGSTRGLGDPPRLRDCGPGDR